MPGCRSGVRKGSSQHGKRRQGGDGIDHARDQRKWRQGAAALAMADGRRSAWPQSGVRRRASLALIACANVALLLLMRGSARGRELAIRAALGGGRGRIALQQVAEGIVLATAGGALGLLLAAFAIDAVVALGPAGIPRLNELHVDWRMAGFALVASFFSGAAAGAISGWQTLRSDLFLSLKGVAGGPRLT